MMPIDAPRSATATLRAAGIVLGRDYPEPVVEHKLGRERALAAYKAMREG